MKIQGGPYSLCSIIACFYGYASRSSIVDPPSRAKTDDPRWVVERVLPTEAVLVLPSAGDKRLWSAPKLLAYSTRSLEHQLEHPLTSSPGTSRETATNLINFGYEMPKSRDRNRVTNHAAECQIPCRTYLSDQDPVGSAACSSTRTSHESCDEKSMRTVLGESQR